MGDLPKAVSLKKIYLDLENPRHAPLSNESEAIKLLAKEFDVRALAKHITDIGGTSPLDLLALVPHPRVKGGYIAAEGNRRVCALKLLDDPDKAGNELDKNYFRSLKNRLASPISTVLAVTFPDMVSARPWVELRHDAPTGVGTKKWEAEEKARFNKSGKGNNPNALALEAMEYARTQQLIPEDNLEKLTITTLTRFLSTPDVRSALGIADNKELKINVPAEQFDSALTKFLMDSAGSESVVTSRANAAERRAYAEDFRASGHSPSIRGISPYTPFLEQPIVLLEPEPELASTPAPTATPQETEPSVLTTAAVPITVQRNNRSRDHDKYVIPSDFKIHIKNSILKRLFDELRTLPAEDFSFSAVYLFRAVIEQTAILFLRETQRGVALPDELHKKLTRMADELKQQGMTDSQLKPLRTMANDKHSRFSAETMGHFVHGGAVPTRMDSIKAWDSISNVMSVALAQLK